MFIHRPKCQKCLVLRSFPGYGHGRVVGEADHSVATGYCRAYVQECVPKGILDSPAVGPCQGRASCGVRSDDTGYCWPKYKEVKKGTCVV